MKLWLEENECCPICHNTEIEQKRKKWYNRISSDSEDIENNIENQNDAYQYTYKELPLFIRVSLLLIMFWLLGNISYWILIFAHHNDNDYKIYIIKDLGNPIFHIFILLWGMIVFIFIGFMTVVCSNCWKDTLFFE